MKEVVHITRNFLIKLHRDAISQRVKLLAKVKELNEKSLEQTVFNVGEYDALSPQEIREIIQGGENISDMSNRIIFHCDEAEKLEKNDVLEI